MIIPILLITEISHGGKLGFSGSQEELQPKPSFTSHLYYSFYHAFNIDIKLLQHFQDLENILNACSKGIVKAHLFQSQIVNEGLPCSTLFWALEIHQ